VLWGLIGESLKKRKEMDVKTKITLQYIVDTASSEVDLKWKLNKFITNGDVSFLGHNVKELNQLIKEAEDNEIDE
jgi:hypothetical protein